MCEISMTFRMGHGGIMHNLRLCDGNIPRQNACKERRFLNEQLYFDDTIDKNDYVHGLLVKTVKAEIGDRLDKLNEHYIKTGHPGMVQTIEQWLDKKMYVKQGKKNDCIQEYVVALGNKFTACPYTCEYDASGRLLDVNDKPIPIYKDGSYDGRRIPKYKDGVISESEMSKKIKKVLREFVQEFIKANPKARVLCASIHCDESSIHLHLNVLWLSSTKNSVGIGLGKTSAMRQQYEEQGIKVPNTKKHNAENLWRMDMNDLLEDVALRHGFLRKDMGNKKGYKTIDEYKEYKDSENALKEKESILDAKENVLNEKETELNEKEIELSNDTIKQEWYYIKKKYPDIYNSIHQEFLKNKKSIKKGIDKAGSNAYNRCRQ